MSLNKNIEYIYILVLFTICNIMVFEVDSSSISVRLLLLVFVSIIATFAKVIQGRLFTDLRRDKYRIAAVVVALCWIIKELMSTDCAIEKPIFVLAVILMYCILDDGEILEPELFQILSVSNTAVYAFTCFARFGLKNQYINMGSVGVSFFIMAVTVDILGYCLYDDIKIWYGINAFIGAFLLFTYKNITSVIITGLICMIIPLIYIPEKRMIRKNAQMMFLYWFLFANMSLITGYIKFFEELSAYSLEISVYIELIIAVFGIVFFNMWDKYAGDEVEEDTPLYVFRSLYQGVIITTIIVISGLAVAVIRGNSTVMNDTISLVLDCIKGNITSEKNIFQELGESSGIWGVLVAIAFMTFIAYRIYERKDTSKMLKAMRIFLIIYILQALVVTQTMANTPICITFAIIYVKAYYGWKPRKIYNRGGLTNETDNTDTVLQRIGDTGDSTQ